MTGKFQASSDDVKQIIADSLSQTALQYFIDDFSSVAGTGKMLRARLALKIGPSTGVPEKTVVHAAAAVEMIHAASLLHDDVIDGGFLRRGAPSFWVERGVPGAILLGDLLLFKALEVASEVDSSRIIKALIKFTGEVCNAESEQELVQRGKTSTWDSCVDIARRKTGALFAFAAYAAGGEDDTLSEALKEAGYLIGTAYQVADDLLDVNGDVDHAGKTLGTDVARKKNTAANVRGAEEINLASYIHELCDQSRELLAGYPDVQTSWKEYLSDEFDPTLEKHIDCLTS